MGSLAETGSVPQGGRGVVGLVVAETVVVSDAGPFEFFGIEFDFLDRSEDGDRRVGHVAPMVAQVDAEDGFFRFQSAAGQVNVFARGEQGGYLLPFHVLGRLAHVRKVVILEDADGQVAFRDVLGDVYLHAAEGFHDSEFRGLDSGRQRGYFHLGFFRPLLIYIESIQFDGAFFRVIEALDGEAVHVTGYFCIDLCSVALVNGNNAFEILVIGNVDLDDGASGGRTDFLDGDRARDGDVGSLVNASAKVLPAGNDQGDTKKNCYLFHTHSFHKIYQPRFCTRFGFRSR